MSDDTRLSSYLDYLPAIFQEDSFLGRFLLTFERMLSLAPQGQRPALEQVIGQIDRYFRPFDEDPDRQAPGEFIPWLAGWVSLSLREDWDDRTRRQFLREIVPLYQKRGTRDGLLGMLQIYVGKTVPIRILDDERDFASAPPVHFFQVQITLSDRDPVALQQKQQIAIAIIEQEKPAHTFYALQILIPTMRLMSEGLLDQEGGEPLVLGENSLLGTQDTGAQRTGESA